jgi:hypothetical protein
MKMKIFLLLLAFSVLPMKAAAQGCAGVMTSEYSTYTTGSAGSITSITASSYLYVNVVVDGTAIIHPSEYCNIGNATHRGVATNTLGGVTSQVWGAPVTPSGYISVSNQQQLLTVPGVIYINSSVGEVICSFLGALFNITKATKWEKALTKEESLETESDCYWLTGPLKIMDCNIDSVPLCTVATTPPDAHLTPTEWQVYPASAPLTWITLAFCDRPIDPKTGANLGPWSCFHGAAAIDDTYTPYPCTHNP